MRITKDTITFAGKAAIRAAGFHKKEAELCRQKAEISLSLLPQVWVQYVRARTGKKVSFKEIAEAMEKVKAVSDLGISFSLDTRRDKPVNIAGWNMELSLYGNFCHSQQPVNILSSENYAKIERDFDFPYYGDKPTIDNPVLRDRLASLNAEHEKLVIEALALQKDVEAAFKMHTTVKRLLESWPEAAALLPPAQAVAAAPVPAIPVEALNSRIGLPK